MFGLFRVITRSGGAVAVCLAMVGLIFYGIAQMSVMIVDEPARGLKVFGVFFAFSIVFCLVLKWILRQAIAQALRPIGAAKEATSRLVSIGEEGGKKAFRSLGTKNARMREASSRGRWEELPEPYGACGMSGLPPGVGAAAMMIRSMRMSYPSREIERGVDLRARKRRFGFCTAHPRIGKDFFCKAGPTHPSCDAEQRLPRI